MMGKIGQWLKITCQDISSLMSEKMDHSLPLSKRLRVRVHLAICKMCKEYEAQLMALRSLARSLGEEDPNLNSSIQLSREAKEKINQSMRSSN